MGFVGLFLKFSLECFHVFAWPLIALGYPLCVSIEAIETDSISTSDTQKLITYWVCLSLILLFEHAFHKLILWLPCWTYVKLVIVFYLLTPDFDGSFYVYKRFVHPCLSIYRFANQKVFLKQDEELVQQVNRDAKRTGAKSLENLIAFKAEFEEPKVGQKDNNNYALERTEEKEFISTIQFGQIENASSGNGRTSRDLSSGISPLKNPRKEWSCALCQVRTTCEANLISHLNGKRHEETCEKLNPCRSQTSKSKVLGIKEMANLHPWTCFVCQVTATSKMDLVSHFQGKRHMDNLQKLKAKIFQELSETAVDTLQKKEKLATEALAANSIHLNPWTCGICSVTIASETSLVSHLEGKRHRKACERVKSMNGMLECEVLPAASVEESLKSRIVEVRNIWWCSICKKSCSSEGNMDSHLNGKKHLANAQELKQV